jgi:spore maturation protein SpmA
MMNYVWLAFVVLAVLFAALTGNMEQVTKAALEYAGAAVDIAIGLIGIMTLWLGIMKVAEKAGMISLLAKFLRPLSRFLFPEVPADHPAVGAIFLNISANWLGLGNAATPFGIKAMESLQSLNPDKEKATDAMIMFLVLNTSSITFVPVTIIAIRTSLHSANPTEIIGPTIFSAVMATLMAVIAAKLFALLDYGFQNKKALFTFSIKGILFTVLIALAVIMLLKTSAFSWFSSLVPTGAFERIVSFLSLWTIPVLLAFIPLLAVIKRVKVYEVLVEGAKEGFQVAVRIIPFLVAILVAMSMFRASGAMAYLVKALSPLTNLIGMPAEVLPAALLRPLSGSGSLAVITELMETHGPDSFIGRLASTIYGCTETTFYVIAVYFGAVQIKNTRYAVAAGLLADCAGILAAVFICRILFL